mmetsp:Transcript_84/g.109  ORF Transcript_84/g.109 Transcript_84/m.109 type:complete len:139 (-) Transcript_84:315-731(-)
MQRNYLQVKQFLEENFPQLRGNISGGNYPPPSWALHMLNLVSYVQMTAIALLLFGDSIWSMFSFEKPPEWYNTCKKNKMQVFMLTFLIIPTFLQSYVTTGAFEIMLNDEVLFSKLDSGKFPTGDGLIKIFARYGFRNY